MNTVTLEGFPDGLRCVDCDEPIVVGQSYSERLVAMIGDGIPIVEITCVPCGLAATAQ